MEKKFADDDEVDKLLEEQYIKEAELMEKALFSDEDFEDYDSTDEEAADLFEDFQRRLRAEGLLPEEEPKEREEDTSAGDEAEKIVPFSGAGEDPVAKAASVPKESESAAEESGSACEESGSAAKESVSAAEKSGSAPEGAGSVSEKKGFRTTKVARVAGIAMVCVLGVFAASMTSEANRKYFVRNVQYLTGGNARILSDNDDGNEKAGMDEYQAIADIEKQLGVDMPEFFYRPSNMKYKSHTINATSGVARIEYECVENILVFYVNKADDGTESKIDSMHGNNVFSIITTSDNITIKVKEIKDEGIEKMSYSAEWKWNDGTYRISGRMIRRDFEKMIENIKY